MKPAIHPSHTGNKGISRRDFLKYGAYGSFIAGLSPFLLVNGCGGKTKRPNILLVTLDTTRADHLSR